MATIAVGRWVHSGDVLATVAAAVLSAGAAQAQAQAQAIEVELVGLRKTRSSLRLELQLRAPAGAAHGAHGLAADAPALAGDLYTYGEGATVASALPAAIENARVDVTGAPASFVALAAAAPETRVDVVLRVYGHDGNERPGEALWIDAVRVPGDG